MLTVSCSYWFGLKVLHCLHIHAKTGCTDTYQLSSLPSSDGLFYPKSPPPVLQPTTLPELRNLIFSSPDKQCALGLIPTALLSVLLSWIQLSDPSSTSVFLSLTAACFLASSYRSSPSSKKTHRSLYDILNYCPISTLKLISKLLEEAIVNLWTVTFCPITSIFLSNLPTANTTLLKLHNLV